VQPRVGGQLGFKTFSVILEMLMFFLFFLENFDECMNEICWKIKREWKRK